jgi:hypothetical protein
MHIWNGRFGITAGIINGGLGLQLANAPANLRTAYIAVAAVMWSIWMLCALGGEIRRLRRPRAENPSRGVRRPNPKVSTSSRETEQRSRGSRGSGNSRASVRERV